MWIHGSNYELVDIFNWQEEAEGMISQMEFVRRVDVQTETIERYVREGKLVPDLVVPMSEHRTFKYFREESLQKYAVQYGWKIINDSNRKDMFMDMIRQMDMSYAYKPVLMKAIMLYADEKGRIKLDDIVAYFGLIMRAVVLRGCRLKRRIVFLPRVVIRIKKPREISYLILSNALRICRCCDTPRRWALCKWMRRCGSI